MKTSIYINYYNLSHIVASKSLIPIHVGKAISTVDIPMLSDDKGSNISDKNASFCELTGHYWAWKNDLDSDYIGFMHYRRFFDFYPESSREVSEGGVILESAFSEDFVEDYGLTDENIARVLSGVDMVLGKPWDVSASGAATLREQYKKASFHYIKDLKLVEKIIAELTPDYTASFYKAMGKSSGVFTNLFVFSRKFFEEYSEWLFQILFEFEKRCDTTLYSAQEKRVIGYIAERLLNVFVEKKVVDDKSLRITYLDRVFVQDTTPLPVAPEALITEKKIVPVVAASDKAYVPHLAALISSVFQNTNHSVFLDFMVLDGGISKQDKDELRRLEGLHPSARISFINMSNAFLDADVSSYFTRATFYRLALPKLLSKIDKVVFLDTDMVVIGDVEELFDVDLGDKYIAAAPDLTMKTFINKGCKTSTLSGGKRCAKYLSDVLGLDLSIDEYFQAGTMVFDLEKMRAVGLADLMIEDVKSNNYWFLDQDVLNKYLKGKVKFLDCRWNSVFIPEDHLVELSLIDLDKYNASRESAAIFHFAGMNKPWKVSNVFGGRYYWKYLRNTPWHEEMLLGVFEQANKPQTISLRIVLKEVWARLPRVVKLVLRPAVWLVRKMR